MLLKEGLVKAIPGSDINDNPNQPKEPALQAAYNVAAIQASNVLLLTDMQWSVPHTCIHSTHICMLISRRPNADPMCTYAMAPIELLSLMTAMAPELFAR